MSSCPEAPPISNASINCETSSYLPSIKNDTISIDSTQSMTSLSYLNDSHNESNSYSNSMNESLSLEPTFSTSTPITKLKPESSSSSAASYSLYSPSQSSSQVNGSSIDSEA
jgi:hypothetical protein